MKISTINSIELSSKCNLRCAYCPASVQHEYRAVGFMTRKIFEETILWVKHFVNRGTQLEVNLFGVGEPLLHSDIISCIQYARLNLPLRIPLHLNTNGVNLTNRLAIRLKNAGISSIDVTGHNAYAATNALRVLGDQGIPHKISFDPIVAPNNWAGQVGWFEPRYPKPYPCPWIGRGQVMVMSNGNITRCCLDAFAKGVLGHITDNNIDTLEVTPFELCKTCHHTIG